MKQYNCWLYLKKKTKPKPSFLKQPNFYPKMAMEEIQLNKNA